MGGRALTGLLVILALAGCQSPSSPSPAPPLPFRLDKGKSVEITPASDDFTERRGTVLNRDGKKQGGPTGTDLTEGELYELPKLTVTRKGFLNFGLSVVTNVEVAVGGKIEWMRVGVVLPGRPAARSGLFTGVEIMAIDGIPIAQLSREDMLHALFERESGEHVRLLVYSRQFGPLPRFVTL